MLAINASDDERNPPELGVMEREMKRVKNGRYLLLKGGPETQAMARRAWPGFTRRSSAELLQQAPRRPGGPA